MKKLCLFLLVIFFRINNLFCVVKGSDTLPSIESAAFFPAVDSDNSMLSFGWFKNGFTLEDATTTCSFQSVFPVVGTMMLNGGRLNLNADLKCDNGTSLATSGIFQGNSFVLDFSASITGFPASYDTVLHQANLFLNSDFTIGGTVHIHGNCLIDGRKNKIVLQDDAHILIDSGSSLKLRNLELSGVENGKIYCRDSSGKLELDNMRFVLSDDYSFTQGSCTFLNNVDLVGPYIFSYDSDQTSTIASDSALQLAEVITFQAGRKNGIFSQEPLYFVDQTSILKIENCTLSVTSSGLSLIRGTLLGDGEVNFMVNSTSTANGLKLGDGTVENDFRFRLSPGAAFNLVGGHFVYDVVNSRNFLTGDIGDKFLHQGASTFYALQNIDFRDVTIKFGYDSIVQMANGANLIMDNTVVSFDLFDYTITATRYGDYASLLAGNGSISLTRGSFPLLSYVTGLNNIIYGQGDCTGPLVFLDNTSTLSFGIKGVMSGGIYLNGSTLILTDDLKIDVGAFPSTFGTVNVQNHILDFPSEDFVWTSTIDLQATNGILKLNSNVSLAAPLTLIGNWTILGNGNELHMVNSGQITIGSDSSVRFKNIVIKDVFGTVLQCADNSGTMIFDNSQLIMSDDYIFGLGAFDIQNSVDLKGTYTFFYESVITSSIESNAQLHVSQGATLAIGKAMPSSQNPLYCADLTSQVLFDNAHFTITNYGLLFTRGSLIFDKEVTIDINPISGGLVFGDGVSSNDPIAEWNAGSVLNVPRGSLTYNATNPHAFVSKTANTTISVGLNFYTTIEQNMTITNIALQTNSLWGLVVAPGKTLSYQNYSVQFPGTQYTISGQFYSNEVNLLGGNHGIIVTTGVLPLANYVLGSGNYIQGLGGVSGPIILGDSSTDLTLALFGKVLGNITLAGGTLHLQDVLDFGENKMVLGAGTINLSDNSMNLIGNDLVWTSTILFEGSGASIRLRSDLKLTSSWIFNGNITIYGNGHKIDLTDAGSIVVGSDSTLAFRNVDLVNISGTNLSCVDNSSHLIFDASSILMNDDFIFGNGSFSVENIFDVTGTYTFFYQSTMTSTIKQNSNFYINSDCQISIGRGEAFGNEPLYFDNITSQFTIDNATLVVTASGMQIRHGHFVLDNDVILDIRSTSTMSGLIIGDGTTEGNTLVDWNAGSEVDLHRGHLTYKNNDPTLFRSRTQNTRANVEAGFVVNLAESLLIKNLTVDPDPASQVWIDPGVVFSYENYQINFPGVSFQIKGQRYNDFVSLLTSNDQIILNVGTMPLATIIAGPGNTIYGAGSVGAPIYLEGPYAALTLAITGRVFADIHVDGNTLILEEALTFGENNTILGSGTVNLTNNSLNLSGNDLVWTGTIFFEGSGASIRLNSDLKLTSSWIFNGDVTIYGNGHKLDLTEVGSIVVGTNSILQFRDVRLVNISGTNLSCADDSSRLIFDQSSLLMNNDFTFGNGSFAVENIFDVTGTYTFFYQSSMTSTVKQNSNFCINSDCQISIGRAETFGNEPLYFESDTSHFVIDNASLVITSSGMCLTRGHLILDHDVTIDIQSTSTISGLIIGDGTDAGNMLVDWNAGSEVNLVAGHLTYQNSDPTLFRSRTQNTSAILGADLYVYIPKNLQLKNITTYPDPSYQLVVDPSAILNYDHYEVNFPGVTFQITGQRYSDYISLLTSNDSIILNVGVMPLVTFVTGPGNTISGSGHIGGPIYLMGPSAQLTIAITGQVFGNIVLGGNLLTVGSLLTLSDDITIQGLGTVDLSNKLVLLPGKDYSWTSTLYWDSNGGSILSLTTNNQFLSSEWTISGDCTIDAQGGLFQLSPTGKIIVERGSILTLKNMVLDGITKNSIYCLDNAGEIVLDNVTWQQNDSYTFDRGSLDIQHDVVLNGTTTFAYCSDQVSTINSRAIFEIDESMTFSYAPSSDSGNLLNFIDSSAKFLLNNATLYSTSTGLQLTQGTLQIQGYCNFISDAQHQAEAIMIGDGISSSQNMVVDIFENAVLDLTSGYLVYNNVT